ncbi:MAG: hypothetical protein KatS3mg052_0479 [Candidatus Roseilinea sp.]|nr:MAG: hypothetical protein KatS3mg052_0479 [Candidatus Roseilinea sp.]
MDLIGNAANTTLHYSLFRIDRVASTSQLVGPPTALSDAAVAPSWSGSDCGSGMAGYDVQARQAPTVGYGAHPPVNSKASTVAEAVFNTSKRSREAVASNRSAP